MAINLNPGADATLVNAAYRAAAGTTPKDYSRTLERAADSYEKTMQAQSQTLGSIAALGTAIGGEMVANANELSAMAAEGAGLDAEGAKVLIEELYANKDAQKELRGINFLQSRETRQKRQALKLEQRELFANIKTATESIRLGSEAVAAGTFKVLRGNEAEADMVNAIIKSNLKDKVTNNKNIARLGRDEKTGELMYTMYKADGTLSVSENGEPFTMTIRQFNKAITTNVDDKGVMKGKLNTINNASAKAGNTSLNGTYHPEMKQMHLNQLDDIVKTDTDLQRAFDEKFGYSNSSFTEDMQRPSNLSMWVYNDLLSVTGSKDGVLADSELTKGIIDIDGKAGISQEDLQDKTNYGILAENILGLRDPEVSKALFKEYTIDKYEAAHKFGYGQKAPVSGKTDVNKTDTNPYGIPEDGLRLGDMIDNRYQIEVRQDLVTDYINDIKAGSDFKFLQNDYSFVDGNWYENYGTKPNEDGQGGVFKYDNTQAMVDDVFQTGGKYFDGLETKIQINPETGEAFNAKAKKSKVKPLELSALGNAKSTRDVFDEIQAVYKTKNKAIKTATGSIGGLLARKSGQSIYITIDGVEKEFSLGGAGGFGGTSVNEDKRISYLTNLESLLNAVNSSLDPEYTNTDYNSTNNTETN